MKALVCSAFGTIASLQFVDMPSRAVGPGDVRIRVTAAGLNPNDVLAVAGTHQSRPELPFVPGGEVAGIVTETGTSVAGLRVGDRVMAMTVDGLGGIAQDVIVPDWAAFGIPSSLPDDAACGFLSSYATAYDALIHEGGAELGTSVLILGASGHVGRAATELAQIIGCRVLAGVRNGNGAPALPEATTIIEASPANLARDVRLAAGQDGVDLVIDPVGGALFRASLSCLRPHGRAVVVGFASGEIPRLPTIQLLLKGISLHGCNLAMTARWSRCRQAGALDRMFGWLQDGALNPARADVFSPSQAGEAFRRLEARVSGRKVAIVFGDGAPG